MRSLRPPTVACEIDASIGNSVPSARSAHSAVCSPIRRDVSPVLAKRSMWARCAARNRSGMSRSSDVPIASSGVQPNIFSAARLHSTMRWSASIVMIASIAERMIASRRASPSRAVASRSGASPCTAAPARRAPRSRSPTAITPSAPVIHGASPANSDPVPRNASACRGQIPAAAPRRAAAARIPAAGEGRCSVIPIGRTPLPEFTASACPAHRRSASAVGEFAVRPARRLDRRQMPPGDGG